MTLHTTAPVGDEVVGLLGDLAGRSPNFTEQDGPFDAAHGWKVDDRCQPLPSERPGDPDDGGSFRTACAVLRHYEMADPRIIRAAFDRDVPLARRDMALEGRFLFLRFPMGVRITHVVDDTIRVDGRRVRRWGWGYSTLEGHLERGRMDWEVWKWVADGSVEFRIHAFSRRGHIPNPIVRLGFALFGEATQERFYGSVLDRMQQLVEARTERPTDRRSCHTAAQRPLLGRRMGPATDHDGDGPPDHPGAVGEAG